MKKNDNSPPPMWNLQDAKARLSELVDRCVAGEPQIILRRGQPAAVLVSHSEYERHSAPRESLISFLQRSPLCGLDLDFERLREPIQKLRDLDL
jgi:prevent-host-death family protein